MSGGKIKNYTSGVPVMTSVAWIEQLLARNGADCVMKDYKNGVLAALCFRVVLPTGKKLAIRLPANVDAVHGVLMGEVRRPRAETEKRVREQAERTAWKLMLDWLEVQVSLLQLQQVEFMQVFLPYVWNGSETFYDVLKANNFKALPAAEEAA